jgi:hypothetical protein
MRWSWTCLLACRSPELAGVRLLGDRDTRYTQAFDAAFTADRIEILKSAPQAPRTNTQAGGFIRTDEPSAPTGC